MRTSRIVRVATVLALAGGGLTAVAASGTAPSVTVTALTVPSGFISPGAGFLDRRNGVLGRTALFSAVLDGDSRLTGAQLLVRGSSGVVVRDLDAGDGLAVFADRGEPGFDDADFAAGPVTSSLVVGRTRTDGWTPVTLAASTEPSQPANRFVVTVHPTLSPLANRPFQLAIPRNGLEFAGGASAPDNDLRGVEVTLDTSPPSAPRASIFKNNTMRPPGQEDSYRVNPDGGDPTRRLVFLNRADSEDDASVLVRLDGRTPAVYAPPTEPNTELFVGDGSRPDPTTGLAPNRQLDDLVYARWVDAAGNLSLPTTLAANRVVPPAAPVKVLVTTDGTVEAPGIGIATETAVKVTTEYSTTVTAPANAVRYVRVVKIDPTTGLPSTDPADATDWVRASDGRAAGSTNVNTKAPRRIGEDGDHVVAEAYVEDVAKNVSTIVTSRPYAKDLTAPRIAYAVPVASGPLVAGSRVRIGFTEPVIKSAIAESGAGFHQNVTVYRNERPGATDVSTGNVPAATAPAVVAAGTTVTRRNDASTKIGITRGAGSSCNTPALAQGVDVPSAMDQPTWGMRPGWVWNGGAGNGYGTQVDWRDAGMPDASAMGTLTLDRQGLETGGAYDRPDTWAPSVRARYPIRGCDTIVIADGAGLVDLVGNAASGVAVPLATTTVPLPVLAQTRDVTGTPLVVYCIVNGACPGTITRDGKLDRIELTFSERVSFPTLVAAAQGGRLTVAGARNLTVVSEETVSASSSEYRYVLEFESDLHTGARPLITLRATAEGFTDVVAHGSGQPVPPFSFVPIDTAPPAVVDVATADLYKWGVDSNGQPEEKLGADGKIDRMVVTYSEAIIEERATAPHCYGYTVTGYSAAMATNQVATSGNPCANPPTTGAHPWAEYVRLVTKAGSATDTDATPEVKFWQRGDNRACPANNCVELLNGISDRVGNKLYNWTLDAARDGARPHLVDRVTRDDDTDGLIDTIQLRYSEPIASASAEGALFSIDKRTVREVFPTFDPAVVEVLTTESMEPTGDTDDRPGVKYLGPATAGITDSATVPNPQLLDETFVAATDGAGPALLTARTTPLDADGSEPGDGSTLYVLFSEAVTGVEPDDFVIAQQQVVKVSGAEIDSATVKLTLVAPESTPPVGQPSEGPPAEEEPPGEEPEEPAPPTGALDVYADTSVMLAKPGVVSDLAKPANPSTQADPVVVPAFPRASLAPRSLEPSPPGTSRTLTVLTGAAGNSGVVGWLLAVNSGEPPLSPSDARFLPWRPDEVTFATAGEHVLRLWTKNAHGQISDEARATIFVDVTAPTISSALLSTTTGTKVDVAKDGTVVRLTTVATGDDADRWPSSGASADFSQIAAGLGNGGSLAPRTWQLQSAPSGRRGTFPDVRVRGTALFPVGLVVATSAQGPFYRIDEENGRLVKRKFVSKGALASWQVTVQHVFVVSPHSLDPVPNGAPVPYRDGSLLRATGTTNVYVMSQGLKRVVAPSVFARLAYSATNIREITLTELRAIPEGPAVTSAHHPVGTVIRDAATRAVYRVAEDAEGLRLDRFATALSLGTHVTSGEIVPANAADLQITRRGSAVAARDGLLVRAKDDAEYYVMSRGRYRAFESTAVLRGLGGNTKVARTASLASLSGTVGGVIGYHSLFVTVRVTDFVGNAASAQVTVRGLGSPE